jgi:ribosomal protein S27AE
MHDNNDNSHNNSANTHDQSSADKEKKMCSKCGGSLRKENDKWVCNTCGDENPVE